MLSTPLTFGILTVSDSCSKGQKQDTAGPALATEITSAFPNALVTFTSIVPDEKDMIASKLSSWSSRGCDIILTTGGTGFSARDVTPEATKAVIERETPAITHAIMSRSLAVTELAMLSRATSGIHKKTLIINFPGSRKAAVECFGFVKKALTHAVALIRNESQSVKLVHDGLQHLHGCESKVKINMAATRSRTSPYPLYEVDVAQKAVMEICGQTKGTELIKIENSLSRVLAEAVFSEDPFPPFRASIKDGYAVKSEDGIGTRHVRDVTAAGDKPDKQPLKHGEAIRISTGAPVPDGANAVVQVEDTSLVKTSEDGAQELEIEIHSAPSEGQDIRQKGSDIPEKSLILSAGDVIDPYSIGVLATLGKTSVRVYKRPSIGIMSTGNELCPPEQVPRPGQIRDSNKLTLLSLMKRHGYDAVDCGIAKDTPNEVKFAFERTFGNHDIIVTTGGVSMGEFDIIKQVLIEDFGANIHFGRVNMKPGKPTTFASLDWHGKRKFVFGLPGNPVSACVTSLLFVIPALKNLEHNPKYNLPKIKVSVEGNQIKNKDIRPEYVRVKLDFTSKGIVATSTGSQMSSRLNSLVGANGLLYLPGNSETEPGKEYDAYIVTAF